MASFSRVKVNQREQLNDQVEKFLAGGGEIQQVTGSSYTYDTVYDHKEGRLRSKSGKRAEFSIK